MAVAWKYTPPRVNAVPVIAAAADKAADAAAHVVLDESQQLVPVDTGALRASGRVVVEEGASAAITYGDDDAAGRGGRDTNDYVVPVHERLDAHHPIGQAKFLESALHSGAERAAEVIAVELRKAL